MPADEAPEEWKEFFDNLEVMVFSGSRHYSNPRTVAEFEHIANQCIQESHQRLFDSEELVAEVCQTLSRTVLMPWGTRLSVQGRMRDATCTENEPGKVSEHLCLLRGPQTQGLEMRNHWIGIVRHDETSYMTGNISWLVKHIAGRGKKRKLMFARNEATDGAKSEVIWDNNKIDKFNKLIGAC
eukprot:gnl/MRDRNA2_/MRDRNA2_77192_c0_seq1.p1 gnl/MRDRNA2_/MRDRNA2_77192_c0~~gnl/MRDRNA2_/MRDRNA2_77192_c0_seq1.p1  ORF type:complete len:183 (-),score=30.34 gnl/MRDRNA2_/MRDRNA2_77192_c0_seq1:165-713(-)